MSDRISNFKATIDPDLRTFFNQILKDHDYIESNHILSWPQILPKLNSHLPLIVQDYYNADLSSFVKNPILANSQDPETIETFLSRLVSKLKTSFPNSPPFTVLHLVNILSFNIPVFFEIDNTPEAAGNDPARYNHHACKFLRSLERCIFVQSSIGEVDSLLEKLGSKNTTEAINDKIIKKLKKNEEKGVTDTNADSHGGSHDLSSEAYDDDTDQENVDQTMVRISWLDERTDLPTTADADTNVDNGIIEETNDPPQDLSMSDEDDRCDNGDTQVRDEVMEKLHEELRDGVDQVDDDDDEEEEDVEELSLTEKSLQDLSGSDLTENDMVSKSPKILITNHNTSLDESSMLGNNTNNALMSQSPKRNEKDSLDHGRLLKKSRSSNSIDILARADEDNDTEKDELVLNAEEMDISTPEKKIIQS